MSCPTPEEIFTTAELLAFAVERVKLLNELGDDLAGELEDALGYVDDYFIKRHRMREPLDAWNAK